MNKRKKIGRNDSCHCGSGRKYKKCHYDLDRSGKAQDQNEVGKKFSEMEVKEYQRKEQQGLGRPIIHASHKGHEFVAVGSEIL